MCHVFTRVEITCHVFTRVEIMCHVFTRMPGEAGVGDSDLCYCVPCLLSASNSLFLLTRQTASDQSDSLFWYVPLCAWSGFGQTVLNEPGTWTLEKIFSCRWWGMRGYILTYSSALKGEPLTAWFLKEVTSIYASAVPHCVGKMNYDQLQQHYHHYHPAVGSCGRRN